VAAAEFHHPPGDWTDQRQRPGVIAARPGEYGFANGKRDLAHERGVLAVFRRCRARCRKPSFCRLPAPGAAERHHPVRQGEGGEDIPRPSLRLVGKFLPPLPGGDAEASQAPQEGGGILHIDIEIGVRLDERRGVVADTTVVEGEHGAALAAIEMVEGTVPPEVMGELVRPLPVGRERLRPGDPLRLPPGHLEHVGDRVRSPEIGRVGRHGRAAVALRRRVVAALLGGEGEAAEHCGEGGQSRAPGRAHGSG
jgi:hypothetical protein